MFSKEKAKQLRMEFWDGFRVYTRNRRVKAGKPAWWILDRTGINALNLRLHIDREKALAGIDIETRNMDKRLALYDKLESLKKLLHQAMEREMTWELDYIRENGKSVSRIYITEEGLDIYNRETWNEAYRFFYRHMEKLEAFYLEYKEYIKAGT